MSEPEAPTVSNLEEKFREMTETVAIARVVMVSFGPMREKIDELRLLLKALDKSLEGLISASDGAGLASPEWECKRCGHRWFGKTGVWPPSLCTKCRSASWNIKPKHSHHRRPGDRAGDAMKRRSSKRVSFSAKLPITTPVSMPPPPPGLRSKLRERVVESPVETTDYLSAEEEPDADSTRSDEQ